MKFFQPLTALIRSANQAAEALGDDYIGTEAFLIGLSTPGTRTARLLAAQGATAERIIEAVRRPHHGMQQVDELISRFKQAMAEEDFETAALLRARIKAMHRG